METKASLALTGYSLMTKNTFLDFLRSLKLLGSGVQSGCRTGPVEVNPVSKKLLFHALNSFAVTGRNVGPGPASRLCPLWRDWEDSRRMKAHHSSLSKLFTAATKTV